MNAVLPSLINLRKSRKKALAVLVDPDKLSSNEQLLDIAELVVHSGVDLLFVGGSLMLEEHFREAVGVLKSKVKVPVVLFPGSPLQVVPGADAILFLSLISGRNPELLIGHHVLAAPAIRKWNMEVIPTGYMLIDGGRPTSVSYVSQTLPIPNNKPDIAVATALAGEMLGLKCIYMDAGSGAENPISPEMINAVSSEVNLPLIVGGGLRDEKSIQQAFTAGADVVVVGNAIENEPELLFSFSEIKDKNYK